MSPWISCSRRLRYCGFWSRLLGGTGMTSQAFLPVESEVMPVNLMSTFSGGLLVGTLGVDRGDCRPKGFRSTITRYESSGNVFSSAQRILARGSPANPITNSFLTQFMLLRHRTPTWPFRCCKLTVKAPNCCELIAQMKTAKNPEKAKKKPPTRAARITGVHTNSLASAQQKGGNTENSQHYG